MQCIAWGVGSTNGLRILLTPFNFAPDADKINIVGRIFLFFFFGPFRLGVTLAKDFVRSNRLHDSITACEKNLPRKKSINSVFFSK